MALLSVLVLISVVIIWGTYMHLARGADIQINEFTAYDCSRPYNIKDVGFAVATNCIKDNKVTTYQNVTYQVLYEERYRVAKGWTCTIDKSQTVQYCGVYDHETLFAPKTYYNLPASVSASACHSMWNSLTYTTPTGLAYKVSRNSVTSIQYDEKGSSHLEGGEVKCSGEDYKLPDAHMVVHQAHVSVHLKITLQEELFHYNEDGITAHSTQTLLPCLAGNNGCETATAAYGWVLPQDKCELAVALEVQGLQAMNTANQEVFMSTDGSLTRFIIKPTTNKCGRVVHSTNAPDWFLYPTGTNRQFVRTVQPGAMSPTSYAKNRDDFLFNYLANAIQSEFSHVVDSDCQKQAELSKLSYWIQHKNPGATTWLIGNGIFGSANGEVIYQYYCDPVQVMARETEKCYQALPVEKLSRHTTRKTATSTKAPPAAEGTSDPIPTWIEPLDDDRPLFMEPLTRRLTHQGIDMPCVTKFAAKYKNINDGWMSHLKSVHGAAAPQLPSEVDERISALDPRVRPQAGVGGVYKQEDIDAMERYMDMPRATTALGVNLVDQSQRERIFTGPVRPEDIFPSYQDPYGLMRGLWGRIVTFLHEWGEVSSVFISLYVLTKLSITLFGWGYNLLILRDIHGCGRVLCWIPFISFFLMRTYRDSPYGMKEREERAQRKTQKTQARAAARRRREEANMEGYLALGQIAPPNAYSNIEEAPGTLSSGSGTEGLTTTPAPPTVREPVPTPKEAGEKFYPNLNS